MQDGEHWTNGGVEHWHRGELIGFMPYEMLEDYNEAINIAASNLAKEVDRSLIEAILNDAS